jgi:hypothetical protein
LALQTGREPDAYDCAGLYYGSGTREICYSVLSGTCSCFCFCLCFGASEFSCSFLLPARDHAFSNTWACILTALLVCHEPRWGAGGGLLRVRIFIFHTVRYFSNFRIFTFATFFERKALTTPQSVIGTLTLV